MPIIGITESATRCTDLGPGLATSLAANHITHAGIVVFQLTFRSRIPRYLFKQIATYYSVVE